MGWENAERNRHYIEVNEKLLNAVGTQRMVEATPDEVRFRFSQLFRRG